MKRWWLRLTGIARPRAPGIGGVILLALAGVGIEILKPWPVKLVVDSLLAGKPLPAWAEWLSRLPGSSRPETLLVWLAGGTLLIYLAAWAAKLAQAYCQAGVGSRLTYDLGGQALEHLQRLSLQYHKRAETGDLVKRVTTDTQCMRDLLVDVAAPLFTSLASLLLMFVVLWQLDPGLSALTLAAAPLYWLAIRRFSGPMIDRGYQEMATQGRMMAVAEQTLSALPLVQAYGREEDEDRKFSDWCSRSGEAYQRNVHSQMQFGVATSAVTAWGRAALMGIGGVFVLAGRISIGDLIVFLSYLPAVYAPMNSLAQLASSISTAAAGARRLFEVLDVEVRPADVPGARDLPERPPEGGSHLRLENVTFGFDPARPVLREVSLEVHPGQTLAVVGENGAGKSTLAGLLLRFYDPQQGRILVDGEDARGVKIASLRGRIAVVLQEPWLLPVTVAENIAYGKPGASREQIREAAMAANAHAFIEHLPAGYDTVVGEKGATLSTGERQRIAIARAMLKDAPIVILDEPTSSLDAETESSVLDALDGLMRGRTVILIAHRPTVIRRADRVVTIDRGQILQEACA
jgi:ATP-binding cassette, subfamily B, bacterial